MTENEAYLSTEEQEKTVQDSGHRSGNEPGVHQSSV